MNVKIYNLNGWEYWYDRSSTSWVCYPIDSNGLRIEHDKWGIPIESTYIYKKENVIDYIKNMYNYNN